MNEINAEWRSIGDIINDNQNTIEEIIKTELEDRIAIAIARVNARSIKQNMKHNHYGGAMQPIGQIMGVPIVLDINIDTCRIRYAYAEIKATDATA